MELPPPQPPQTHTSWPSSAFHSATQSPLSASASSSPLSAKSGSAHLPVSPFADPPLTPYPFPSFRPSAERLPGSYVRTRVSSNSDNSSSNGSQHHARHGSQGGSDLERHLDPTTLSARVRSCDVYLSLCRRASPLLLRFVKWLRAELEMQGVSCFVSDRSRCRDACAHGLARAAMDNAAFGVIVLTRRSFSNPYTIEEILMFAERRKLVPIFFGLSKAECNVRDIIERRGEQWDRYGGELWSSYGGLEEEWREAVNGLTHTDVKLEANAGNFRDCILEAVALLGMGLGRRSVVEKVKMCKELSKDEFPFPRNPNFVGRKKELLELELMLFGDVERDGKDECISIRTRDSHRRDSTAVRSSRNIGVAVRERVAKQYGESSKGKEPMAWKVSENEIEMHGVLRWEKPYCLMTEGQGGSHRRKNTASETLYGKGVACICGDSGIGKTELLLEFAYKFSQRYKMILWVRGETRYLRLNYMKLLSLLGVDVTVENDLCLERNGPRNFEEIEEEAIRKVQKELMRDIPFLLVIDNLESGKDWWDGRDVMEILPRFGGETHVMVSTRLPRVMNIEPLRLLYLSGAEAMSLMKGSLTDPITEDADALRLIEEKLGRLPFGLALVGAILSELPLNPAKLLDTINRMPYRELVRIGKEDLVLKRNPFLVQLLDVCFSIFDHAEKPRKLATKMVQASCWFASSPIPISMLALAACEAPEEHHGARFWRKWARMFTCMCMTSSVESSEAAAKASSMLVRFRIGSSSTKTGYISFHDIVKLYARERGNGGGARSVIRAISIEGSIPQHSDHIWAACFLLFKFGSDPVSVDLSLPDLLSFIKRFILPLALHSFVAFFRCNAVLEILRLSTEALEVLEESFLSEANNARNRSLCLRRSTTLSTIQSDPLLYQDFAHLRATLLETRAKLMVRGGLYDIGERLCRTAVSIKEVIYGWEHPETMSTRETLERLMRFQSKF